MCMLHVTSKTASFKEFTKNTSIPIFWSYEKVDKSPYAKRPLRDKIDVHNIFSFFLRLWFFLRDLFHEKLHTNMPKYMQEHNLQSQINPV